MECLLCALVMNGNTFCKGHIYESGCIYKSFLLLIYLWSNLVIWYIFLLCVEMNVPSVKFLEAWNEVFQSVAANTHHHTTAKHIPHSCHTVKYIIDMIQYRGKDGVTLLSFVLFLVDFKKCTLKSISKGSKNTICTDWNGW